MTDPTPHDPLQAPAPAQGANDDAALREAMNRVRLEVGLYIPAMAPARVLRSL